jgi:hypothetical protein
MIFFFSILFVPLLVAAIVFFVSRQICWKEVLCIVGVQILVAGASAGICYYSATDDSETWNSRVSKKEKEYTSCSHSYSCRCRQSCSGSGKNRSCHQVCDTCYEHSNDWNWAVYTAAGEGFDIDRIDRRGSHEPPRWTAVKIGEPTSRVHSYTNYIKAAPDTLFRRDGKYEKYQSLLPQYPQNVYDYHRMNRLILVNGAKTQDPAYWNADLMELNAKIGSSRQSNVIVVLARNLPPDFFYALEQAWLGGKKNDVILVVGTDTAGKAAWVNVMTWELNELFKVKVRDDLLEKGSLERWDVVNVLEANIVKYHKRKPMADFEYLKSSITPTVTGWVVSMLVGFIISIGLSILFHKNEMFPEYRGYRY